MRFLTLTVLLAGAALSAPQNEAPLRLAIAGLTHGHVDGFFRAIRNRTDVTLVGVAEPDTSLHEKYAAKYGLDRGIFGTDVAAMIDRAKPEVVAAFSSTYDHAAIVEASAARRVHVMMEKPLAVSMEHAGAIQRAADRSGIHVIVNYETTWYASHGAMWDFVKQQRTGGEIRKMVAMDGHQGPKEIGVGPEFFGWLTDPVKNGAGALFDFGCYGANLFTWMMDNQRPLSVTAIVQRIKPHIYPNVDDEASVLVEYPKAQGIIQASWNWPFNRKDFEVYTESAYAIATGGNSLRIRMPGRGTQEELRKPDPLPADDRDPVAYLLSIVRGKRKPSGLSSLENNMIVTEILAAARESARTGKTIRLAAK